MEPWGSDRIGIALELFPAASALAVADDEIARHEEYLLPILVHGSPPWQLQTLIFSTISSAFVDRNAQVRAVLSVASRGAVYS
jgi:hypothetical protein